ncbi:hypothetical protein FKM82_007679 [Ascaphus truei]
MERVKRSTSHAEKHPLCVSPPLDVKRFHCRLWLLGGMSQVPSTSQCRARNWHLWHSCYGDREEKGSVLRDSEIIHGSVTPLRAPATPSRSRGQAPRHWHNRCYR